MNLNSPKPGKLIPASDRQLTECAASDEELRDLAEDIVRHCPSLTQLLLALGSKKATNPIHGLN